MKSMAQLAFWFCIHIRDVVETKLNKTSLLICYIVIIINRFLIALAFALQFLGRNAKAP